MAPDDFSNMADQLPEPFRLLIKDEVASTNDEARLLGETGAADGLVVMARKQTAGRGRRGAAWFASPGESLAFSVLLRPQEPPSLWPRLALAAGLAVAEAVETQLPLAGIKWPNDVWVGRKKIAGILVEAGRGFAIVGIGLNVNTLTFPESVADIATSLALENGGTLPLPEVLGAILHPLAHRVRQIGADFESILHGVRQRCVLTGHDVSLLSANGPLKGRVEGIAPGGELILRNESGLHRLLQADEVRIHG